MPPIKRDPEEPFKIKKEIIDLDDYQPAPLIKHKQEPEVKVKLENIIGGVGKGQSVDDSRDHKIKIESGQDVDLKTTGGGQNPNPLKRKADEELAREARFREYVPFIEEEARKPLEEWFAGRIGSRANELKQWNDFQKCVADRDYMVWYIEKLFGPKWIEADQEYVGGHLDVAILTPSEQDVQFAQEGKHLSSEGLSFCQKVCHGLQGREQEDTLRKIAVKVDRAFFSKRTPEEKISDLHTLVYEMEQVLKDVEAERRRERKFREASRE
ncbi:hypothetical protein KVT40_007605 [Elsinoe batatas]|uniref:Uncharacterized protein n=1 Tax=Elsinoe batatas TaxID=2601811 RepID=A0A8K0PES9_9PEZI|nr:hypothetical protein KVT40_007605 [Elsinoe batatas]